LYGLDVLLDDHLKPWLLEVNGNPSLEPYTSMEVPIKARLVRDMFRTVGLHGEENVKHTKKRESRRKGAFVLIFPRSIAPKSGKRRKGQKPALGLRWDEIEAGDVALAPATTEVPMAVPVEEKEEVAAKVEERLDVPAAPVGIPCC